MIPGGRPCSVTEVVSRVKKLLETNLEYLVVEGEISNLTRSTVGHWYFTLKDRESALQVALFKGQALRNPAIRGVVNGEKVICTGGLGVYSKRGTFQLICQTLHPVGAGDLNAQFEALKQKLAAEGLFDMAHKQPIPPLPQTVAVITAEQGAALQDFLQIYRRRSLWMDITLIPCPVQGDHAGPALVQAIRRAVQRKAFDVLVLTRGGGSIEDLWAFNYEPLAQAIAQCPIPVISAVGHEVDFTIADYVADLRCETPSAAAQVLTEAQTMVQQRLEGARKTLLLKISEVMSRYQHQVLRGSPATLAQMIQDKVITLQKRLQRSRQRLSHSYEFFPLHESNLYLDELMQRGREVLGAQTTDYHQRLQRCQDLIHAFDVKKVLQRGFCYLTHGSHMVTSATQLARVPELKPLRLHFHDGQGVVEKVKESFPPLPH